MIFYNVASTNDVPTIQEVIRITTRRAYSHIYQADELEELNVRYHSATIMSNQIHNSNSCFLVVKDDNAIIGLCSAQYDSRTDRIDIKRLYVLPAYQRKRIGRILVRTLFSYYPRALKSRIIIEQNNICALSFCEQQGFAKTNSHKFSKHEVLKDSFVMEKHL